MSPRAGVADVRHLSRIALLAALYVLLAYVTLAPQLPQGELGKIVWPASGVALAFLLLYGVRLWPGVALGAFLATELTSGHLLYSLTTAAGNSLEVVSATLILRRVVHFDARMERARDVVALVCAGAAGAGASALFGVLGLHLSDLASPAALSRIGWKWTLGHTMGLTAVTPFVLTVSSWWKERRHPGSRGEALALFLLLIGVGSIAFWGGGVIRDYDLEYLPFPLLVWAAFRFGVHGAASANLITSGMAALGTAEGWAPFVSGSSSENLLLTWSFVTVSAVTTLLLSAVVTEGRRSEEERRKSETRYRTLIEQAADGIFSADPNGLITDVNSRGCDMLGLERDSVLRLELPGLAAFPERERVRSLVDALLPGKAAISSWHVLRGGEGDGFPAEVSIKRLDDGRLQAFVRDVTERLALEEQLSQSQKMEAVGLLAGGIAHDFNNLLTAIIGHSDFALMRLSREDRVRGDIEEVSRAAGRAADLTRKLLAFARKQLVEPKLLSVPDLVRGMERMLKRVLGEHIELTIRIEEDPWPVKADPVQLEQVILNITINARDAMPGGGRLDIECRNLWWSGDGSNEASPGPYATLTVRDTGVGMDADTLSRVFEPFYTTKDRSHGTGLGLAVSYGIVKQAGGYIWATSELGQGSTFQILLPRSIEAEMPVAGEEACACKTAPRESAESGGETILLIEDEPLVRDLALEVLRAKSYQVLTARDGEEALSIARAHPSEIHLTLTDVVLPAMSGKEVARRLREARPGLKVLFMSGYAEEQVVHRGVVEEDVAFLAKPFTPAALTEKVRSVLSEEKTLERA